MTCVMTRSDGVRTAVAIGLFAVICGGGAEGQPAPRPVDLADYYRVECMGGPALSPDGRTGAFARTVLVESENRRHSEIWTVPADGCGGAKHLVAGAARHAARVRFAALSGFWVGLLSESGASG